MGQGPVKVFQHPLQVGDGSVGLPELFVALPDGLRHFALAKVGSGYGDPGGQQLADLGDDLIVVILTAAEACGAEEKDFLIGEGFQKGSGFFVTAALVGPEAHKEQIGLQGLGGGLSEADQGFLLLGG